MHLVGDSITVNMRWTLEGGGREGGGSGLQRDSGEGSREQ